MLRFWNVDKYGTFTKLPWFVHPPICNSHYINHRVILVRIMKVEVFICEHNGFRCSRRNLANRVDISTMSLFCQVSTSSSYNLTDATLCICGILLMSSLLALLWCCRWRWMFLLWLMLILLCSPITLTKVSLASTILTSTALCIIHKMSQCSKLDKLFYEVLNLCALLG